MKAIFNILTGTPWWVYLLLSFLIYIGIKALKPYTIWLPKLFITPTIINLATLMDILKPAHPVPYHTWIWVGSLVMGSAASWVLFRHLRLQLDRKKQVITLPGSYTILVILMAIFVTHYCWGVIEAIYPTPWPLGLSYGRILSLGALDGLTVGKCVSVLYKFYTHS